MIRAILFDMDGLMLDTETLYWDVGRQIARGFGKTVADETFKQMMGRDRKTSCEIFIRETGIPLTVDEVMLRREEMMLERFKGGVTPMPGLLEILERFRGKLKLGVATSSPLVMAQAGLAAVGALSYFDALTAGDEISRGKPDPQIYLTAMKKLGVSAEESVVLEDAPMGAEAGYRSGAFVIAVPSALTADEDFTKVSHARVGNLFDAADLIAKRITK